MKKRLVAFLFALALLIALLPAGAATVASAETTEQQYQVGYSIRNINPWVSDTFDIATDVGSAVFVDPSTTNKKIYPSLCSLVGNQVDWSSIIADVFDDNNDGARDEKDGIFVTCTAVSHGAGTEDEKTVLFFTMDAMKTYTEIVADVRAEIVEQYGDAYGIAADQIMVSSNHSHSSPQYTESLGSYIDTATFDTDEKVAKLKADRKTYYNWVVEQMVAAAEDSLKDRAAATMSRGSVDATDATAALGYNKNSNGVAQGYQMNAIRHYEKTVANKYYSSQQVSYISSNATPSASKLKEALQANDILSYLIFEQGTVETKLSDDSDNNMYVLRFEFDEDSGKQPVVFVNWRAHSTMNSGIERTSISSDYANGLRSVLRDTYGYRAAFFLGAAGNVVASPTSAVYTGSNGLIKEKMDWLYEATNKSGSLKINEADQTFIYGRMLAEIADYCMDNCMTDPLPAGEIKNFQYSWSGEKQIYSNELKAAALAVRAKVEADMKAASVDIGNITKYISENASKYFPYRYTDPTTKKVAILNTRLHYNSVYSQAISTSTATKVSGVELNAILLGDNVAFVTSPNELADYYHDFSNIDAGTLTEAQIEALNDWYNLKDDAYGMPFVLGYSNQNSGYIANWLDYHSNSEEFYKITGKGQHGYMIYSPGTYESLTSAYAQGQGEALIKVYDKVLDIAAGAYDRTAMCESCGTEKVWKPLFAENANSDIGAGHYYLVEDLNATSQLGQWSVGTKLTDADGNVTGYIVEDVCIDLMGHAKTSMTRNFIVNNGSKLSIMDSVGGGCVQSQTYSNNPGGGNISVSSGGTFNLYGGTLKFIKLDNTNYYGTGVGGVVSLNGTLNMYGGTIEGAELVQSTYGFTNNGCGGAIYVYGSGKLNVYGGTITSGSVPENGKGPCIFLEGSGSRVTLSGNANVEDIYYMKNAGACLNISGAYTGTAGLTFDSAIALKQGLDIGNITNSADISGATLTVTDEVIDWKVQINGTNLVLAGYNPNTVAIIGDTEYATVQDAVDHYTDTVIKLVRDEDKALVVDEGKDIYLDLNGYDINSQVTVSSGTLYCKDSMTDDYTVKDTHGYGKIVSYTGSVKGMECTEDAEGNEADGYLMITEADVGTSFHAVDLELKCMTLRAEVDGEVLPSVYYKSNFKGDEKVAAKVRGFGVALSVVDVPTADNIQDSCKYSTFTTFNSGAAGNSGNGTLLKGIMKKGKTSLINNRNANMDVYGRAYILTDDGYMFGMAKDRTLKEQLQGVDQIWSTLSATQKAPVINMYNTFSDVMKNWELTNIAEAVGPAQDGALKVLVVGNSHGLDATNLLYEVFKDQGYDEQELVLGALYYSGCNMGQHADFMTNNKAQYSYYENDGSNADGSWKITNNATALTALEAHQWDIVVLQQMNHRAARESDYVATQFKTVIDYIYAHQVGTPKLAWHMVWSNPDGQEYLDPGSSLSHPTKTNTNWVDNHVAWFPSATDSTVYDQSVMYQKVIQCTQTYIEGDKSFLGSDYFDFVIPSATAIEYAQDVLGLSQAQIYRDYTHMNDYGRLITAYLWYAKIMELDQISSVGISEIPSSLHHSKSKYPGDLKLTDDMKLWLRNSVNYALDNPYKLP